MLLVHVYFVLLIPLDRVSDHGGTKTTRASSNDVHEGRASVHLNVSFPCSSFFTIPFFTNHDS